jgi:hypothetical protein
MNTFYNLLKKGYPLLILLGGAITFSLLDLRYDNPIFYHVGFYTSLVAAAIILFVVVKTIWETIKGN